MLKERRLAANAVAEKLFAAEAAIDAAVSAVAQLTAVMPTARQDAKLAACVGQDALTRAMETCMHLVAARADIIATHEALFETQHKIGLGAVSFLDVGGDKPTVRVPGFEGSAKRHLSVAA